MDIPTVYLNGVEVTRRREEAGWTRDTLASKTWELHREGRVVDQAAPGDAGVAVALSSSTIRDIEQGYRWRRGKGKVRTDVEYITWYTLAAALDCDQPEQLLAAEERTDLQITKEGNGHLTGVTSNGKLTILSTQIHPQSANIDLAVVGKLSLLLDPKGGKASEATEVIKGLYQFFPREYAFTEWHARPDLVILSELTLALVNRYDVSSKEAGRILYQGGRAAAALGQYQAAEKYLEKSHRLFEERGWLDLDSHSLTELANLHYSQRKYRLAAREARQVLQYRLKEQMADEWVAQAYCDLGTIQLDLGSLEEARANVVKAVELWTPQALGGDKREYSWGLLTLACADLALGRYGPALVCCKSAAMIKAAELSSDHPLLSYFYCKQAEMELGVNEVEAAAKTALRACDNWGQSYGVEHPFLAGMKFTLAKVRLRQGRSKEGLELLEWADAVEANANGTRDNRRLAAIRGELAANKPKYRSRRSG